MARDRLTRRLVDARQRPLALLVAPAGYGKTSVLAEWAACDARPFAWVAVDPDDDDPAILLAAVAQALDDVEPIGWGVFEALSSGRPDAFNVALERLARALGRSESRFVLVVDDLRSLRAGRTRSLLKTVWEALPSGCQLALACRSDAGLPVGRLRTQGRALELRANDLAMTRSEGAALLATMGLTLRPEEILTLMRRTEGWPAGLKLAALSLGEQGKAGAVAGFAGDDRFVAEYVREEILGDMAAERLDFVLATSVLDRLSAPLCDSLLGRKDSAAELAALAHENVPLVVLDRSATTYRYNALFGDVLRAELRRVDPGREVALHRRASTWLEKEGDTERAVRHAIDAQDLPRAGRLLWSCAPDQLARGRAGAIGAAFGRLDEEQLANTPLLALVAASVELARGNLYEVERWTALAATGRDTSGSRRGRNLVEAGVAVMGAASGRHGVARMGADASHAHDLLDEHSAWRPVCRFFEGVASHLGVELDAARAQLEEGAYRAAVCAPVMQALCLAQLALLTADDDPDRAASLASRARRQIERCNLERCPAVALVLAVSSACRAQRGENVEAAADLKKGLDLLGRFTDPSPWYDAECRIVMARTALRLNGPAAAEAILTPAATSLRRTTDAPLLTRWLDEVRGHIELATGAAPGGDWCLTAAELRVLRYLPSHLSFREIAERLYVSANTVKTHARAIYRKLDVGSRGDAVDRARGAGIVDPVGGA